MSDRDAPFLRRAETVLLWLLIANVETPAPALLSVIVLVAALVETLVKVASKPLRSKTPAPAIARMPRLLKAVALPAFRVPSLSVVVPV